MTKQVSKARRATHTATDSASETATHSRRHLSPSPRRRVSSPSPAAAPSLASLARRRRVLLNEARSADVTPKRQAEIYVEINGPLRNVPTLSQQEIDRLGAGN